MKAIERWVWLVVFLLVGAFGLDAGAQQARAPADGRTAASGQPLKIREIGGYGPRGLVRTPEYSTSVQRGKATAQMWAQLFVTFDTDPEWLDEITVQYYALLYDKKKDEYSLLKGGVSHNDVPRGKGHLSAMYVRPSALERYGVVVAVAAEVLRGGEAIAVTSEGRLAKGRRCPRNGGRTPN